MNDNVDDHTTSILCMFSKRCIQMGFRKGNYT